MGESLGVSDGKWCSWELGGHGLGLAPGPLQGSWL